MDRRGCAGTLLDIGCGRGILMADARARGWGVTGVEPARCIAEEGIRDRGLDIMVGTLEEAGLPAASFDAVIFSHSLEHLLDPAGTMREAAGLMKPGGWMYIETPNWGSLSRRLMGRRWWNMDLDNHLFLFSPRAIEFLGHAAGLAVREFRGTHFDAPAVLIRLAHFRDPAMNDPACINECRERALSIRGAWRASRLLQSLAGALLGRGYLNDYLLCWLQKPADPR
jgi:SAM-dependent methyltransferase